MSIILGLALSTAYLLASILKTGGILVKQRFVRRIGGAEILGVLGVGAVETVDSSSPDVDSSYEYKTCNGTEKKVFSFETMLIRWLVLLA